MKIGTIYHPVACGHLSTTLNETLLYLKINYEDGLQLHTLPTVNVNAVKFIFLETFYIFFQLVLRICLLNSMFPWESGIIDSYKFK